MSRMLTDPDRPLRRSHLGDYLSLAARAQTLTVLARLERGERKGSVIQFLSEAGLINGTYLVISLRGAILQGAILKDASLHLADLHLADLQGANLRYANGLTQDQIEETFGDEDTILPEGINPPKSWSVSTDESAEEE